MAVTTSHPYSPSDIGTDRAATASGATVRLLDGARVIGTTAPVTLAAGRSVRVAVVWKSPTRGTHTLTAVADPANTVQESKESNNKCQGKVSVS